MRTVVFALALVALAATLSRAAAIIVHPGESIQAALDRAVSGDTVVVQPGVYVEAGHPCPHDPSRVCAVTITKSQVKLLAARLSYQIVVLRAAAGQDVGIAVANPASQGPDCLEDSAARLVGAAVEGFTIEGFDRSGIQTQCTDGAVVRSNTLDGGEQYGVEAAYAVGGRISKNAASGARHAAIYLAGSRGVSIDRNVAFSSGSGIGLVNVSDALVSLNIAFDNTAGILTLASAGAPLPPNERNAVEDNYVFANNRSNHCGDGEVGVCAAPRGTGILLLGSKQSRAVRNNVTANDAVGIGVADLCTVLALGPVECAGLGYDAASTGNEIRDNASLGNAIGQFNHAAGFLYNDLAWDFQGSGNCWSGNNYFSSFPPFFLLPRCP